MVRVGKELLGVKGETKGVSYVLPIGRKGGTL